MTILFAKIIPFFRGKKSTIALLFSASFTPSRTVQIKMRKFINFLSRGYFFLVFLMIIVMIFQFFIPIILSIYFEFLSIGFVIFFVAKQIIIMMSSSVFKLPFTLAFTANSSEIIRATPIFIKFIWRKKFITLRANFKKYFLFHNPLSFVALENYRGRMARVSIFSERLMRSSLSLGNYNMGGVI